MMSVSTLAGKPDHFSCYDELTATEITPRQCLIQSTSDTCFHFFHSEALRIIRLMEAAISSDASLAISVSSHYDLEAETWHLVSIAEIVDPGGRHACARVWLKFD
jgi:hypothetical protein